MFHIREFDIYQLKNDNIEKGDCELIECITKGWPKNRRDVMLEVNVFWPYRDELHYIDVL